MHNYQSYTYIGYSQPHREELVCYKHRQSYRISMLQKS